MIIWLPATLSAQVSSDKGWFTADFNAGCAPFSITIEHTGVRSGSLFIDFFGDPADPFSGTGFTDTFIAGEMVTSAPYTTAGTFFIRVVDQSGSGSNQDRFDFLEVTVTEPIAPTFTVGLCNNNQVLLTFDFAQDSYDFYEIDFGDGNPATTLDKTGSNTLTYAYATEATYTINVSGRLNNGANTGCGNATPVTFSTLLNIPAPNINSMTIVDATTVNFSYDALIPDLTYALYQSTNGGAFTEVATIDPSTDGTGFQFASTLPNTDFNFGQYAFHVVVMEACSSTPIASNNIQNIRAGYMAAYTVGNLVLDRMWNTQDPDGILNDITLVYDGGPETITPAVMGSSPLNLTNCSDAAPFFFEATFGTAVSRSIVILTNLSANSLTPEAPNAPTGVIAGGGLQFNVDPAPFAAAEYRIYSIGEGGNRQLEVSGTSLSYTLSNFNTSGDEACFVLTYVDECGHESDASDPLCFQFTPSAFLPTAFTPNGDGVNDTFTIPQGLFIEFHMEIYNRWGSLVFVTNDAAVGWDGNVNGKAAPMGGYVYRINYNSGQGSPVSLSGSFTLIR